MFNDGSKLWPGVIPKFSLLGVVLSASSTVALLCFASYALLFGVRMSVHYDFLLNMYRLIGMIITSGFVLGVAGAWKRSPTRWLTLILSILLALV